MQLQLSSEEWLDPIVQSEIARYVQHLATVKANVNTGEVSNARASDFTFDFGGGTTLTVSMMEKLDVWVDGAAINFLAPVLAQLGGTLAYTENAAASVIDGTITLTDVDDTQMAGATVRISAGFTAGDVLGTGNLMGTGITATYNASTGVLTFSGPASKAAYEAALESVTYRSTSEDPTGSSASRTIEWTVTDANSHGTGAATSAAGTSTINITPVNDAPVTTPVTLRRLPKTVEPG